MLLFYQPSRKCKHDAIALAADVVGDGLCVAEHAWADSRLLYYCNQCLSLAINEPQ
jgi:hypothetical protein